MNAGADTFGSLIRTGVGGGGFSGMKAADFNRDGNLDLLVNSDYAASAYLLLGNGNSTFAAATVLDATILKQRDVPTSAERLSPAARGAAGANSRVGSRPQRT